jgi:hypothetical protein
MARFTQIVQYFESLARQHVGIQHTDTEKHFYRFEIDEVLSGLGNINYPALILEAYAIGYTDNKSDNILKNRKGAFILLDTVPDRGDHDAIHAVWDELEEIGDDILARIRADKQNRNVSAVRNFDIGNTEVSIIANRVGNDYGLRYEFELGSVANTDVNPERWIDNSGSNG